MGLEIFGKGLRDQQSANVGGHFLTSEELISSKRRPPKYFLLEKRRLNGATRPRRNYWCKFDHRTFKGPHEFPTLTYEFLAFCSEQKSRVSTPATPRLLAFWKVFRAWLKKGVPKSGQLKKGNLFPKNAGPQGFPF